MEDKKQTTGNDDQDQKDKNVEGGGKDKKDFFADIMQTENDIDPGNEHHHQIDSDVKPRHTSNANDDTGTAGS